MFYVIVDSIRYQFDSPLKDSRYVLCIIQNHIKYNFKTILNISKLNDYDDEINHTLIDHNGFFYLKKI